MARKPAEQSVSREEIILAAADVLYRNGYEATTMKDIAAEVNLTAASLYHHFQNKDELVLAVLEIGLERVIGQLEPITQADMPAAQKLVQMIRTHVVNLTEHPSVGAAMVFEMRSLMNPPQNGTQRRMAHDFLERRKAFFARRDDFEEMFRRIIREGVQAGEFRPVDEQMFTKMMLGAHNWVSVWYRPDGRLDGAAIATFMAENFLHSLGVVHNDASLRCIKNRGQ